MSQSVTTESNLKQSAAAERKKIRKERLAQLRKNKAFIVGASILGFWVLCALIGQLLVRIDPNALGISTASRPTSPRTAPTGSAPTATVATSFRASSSGRVRSS